MDEKKICVREARVSDAEALCEIYAYYETEVPSVAEFTDRICSIQAWYPYLVAECNGQILGYAYAHRYHERAAFAWDVEVSIYIHQEKRRGGLGRILYEALEAALKKQGVVNCYALVAEPETEDDYLTFDSLKFHQKMGYHIAGTQHYSGYKFDRWYDLLWMEKTLGVLPERPEPFRPFPALTAEEYRACLDRK